MARKNSRAASGSVTIRQRSDGTWEGRFTYLDELGAKKRRSIYAPTQKECRRKLTAALKAADEGSYKAPQHITVGEWMTVWLETYCTNLKPYTRSSYTTITRNHIMPNIGTLNLQAVRNIHVQKFYNRLQEQGLSAKTIRNIGAVLHKSLSQAIKQGYIAANPCDSTTYANT